MNNLIQKYRAKLANSDTWVYGYPIVAEGEVYIADEHTFTKVGEHKLQQNFDISLKIDENTLCRDTGLKTKDGEKIFQNDIIFDNADSYRNGYYKVIYNTNRNTFELESSRLRLDLTRTRSEHFLTIVGNCIENSELLDKVYTN